jgi:hypothetical protein
MTQCRASPVASASSFVGTDLSKVVSAPTALVCKLLVVSSFIWERAGSSTMSWHSFSRAWWETWLLALRPPAQGSARGSCWMSYCLPKVVAILCLGLLSCRRMIWLGPCKHGPCVVQERHDGSAAQWWWQTYKGPPVSWVLVAIQPIANHYTDCSIPALLCGMKAVIN